jgi:hypothetical protein
MSWVPGRLVTAVTVAVLPSSGAQLVADCEFAGRRPGVGRVVPEQVVRGRLDDAVATAPAPTVAATVTSVRSSSWLMWVAVTSRLAVRPVPGSVAVTMIARLDVVDRLGRAVGHRDRRVLVEAVAAPTGFPRPPNAPPKAPPTAPMAAPISAPSPAPAPVAARPLDQLQLSPQLLR